MVPAENHVPRVPDDATVSDILLPCSSLYAGLAFKSFSIFQVDYQPRHVQDDRHFLADRNLLGLAVYLENAAERLPLYASGHQQKSKTAQQSL